MSFDVVTITDDILKYLEGVEGIVEADGYTHHMLWQEFADDPTAIRYGPSERFRYSWKETGSGYGAFVGEVVDMPVFISLLTATVNDRKLLFWHATSQVVDHRLIEKWFTENLPTTAFRNNDSQEGINQTDATNFINIIRRNR